MKPFILEYGTLEYNFFQASCAINRAKLEELYPDIKEKIDSLATNPLEFCKESFEYQVSYSLSGNRPDKLFFMINLKDDSKIESDKVKHQIKSFELYPDDTFETFSERNADVKFTTGLFAFKVDWDN